MNAKEKSKDLVDKFLNQMRRENSSDYKISSVEIQKAKDYALIAIEEMLKVIPENLYSQGMLLDIKNPTYDYYEQVKIELTNYEI